MRKSLCVIKATKYKFGQSKGHTSIQSNTSQSPNSWNNQIQRSIPSMQARFNANCTLSGGARLSNSHKPQPAPTPSVNSQRRTHVYGWLFPTLNSSPSTYTNPPFSSLSQTHKSLQLFSLFLCVCEQWRT